MILDIHTHQIPPRPRAIVSVSAGELLPMEGQYYSVGIHPWHTMEAPPASVIESLRKEAALPCVAAIGECGYDALKGGPAFRQLQVLKMQVELSEELRKPLILHDVKAHDIILGCHRDLSPSMPWAIHGFRGKPELARMFARKGMYLSFSDKFNSAALAMMLEEYPDRILAETDESPLSIEKIVETLSASAGRDLTPLLEKNAASFFRFCV